MTPQRQSQFTPKMKANAVPRLLSSLVGIDQYNERNGMTSFKEFLQVQLIVIQDLPQDLQNTSEMAEKAVAHLHSSID